MEIAKMWAFIPRGVMAFLLKALLIFILWKSLYLIFLSPDRILDAPLTRVVAVGAARTLQTFSHNHKFTVVHEKDESEFAGTMITEELETIYYDNKLALAIADRCNALELYVLYVGFIVCFPAPASRKLFFSGTGVLSIFILNILRVAALSLASIHYPDYLDFAHHFVFNISIYLLIFWLWFIFSRKLTMHEANN